MALSWLGFLALVAVSLVAVRPALPGPAYAAALTVAGLAFCAVLGRLDRTLPTLLRAPAWQHAGGVAGVAIGTAVELLGYGYAPLKVEVNMAFLLVGIAFVEEWVFRGFLWGRLEAAGLGRGGVLVGTTLLFWAMHAVSWIVNGFDPLTAGFQLLWGLVFGGLRLATGRLVLPVFAHALVDILGG